MLQNKKASIKRCQSMATPTARAGVLAVALLASQSVLAEQTINVTWLSNGSSFGMHSTFYPDAPKSGNRVGEYGYNSGRFVGTFNADRSVFEGHWVQSWSQQDCGKPIDGSNFYGRVVLNYSAADAFTGKWGYCDGALEFDITGEPVK